MGLDGQPCFRPMRAWKGGEYSSENAALQARFRLRLQQQLPWMFGFKPVHGLTLQYYSTQLLSWLAALQAPAG